MKKVAKDCKKPSITKNGEIKHYPKIGHEKFGNLAAKT